MMKKIAYFDCFSGISGDMLLGAFVDCGLSLAALKKELSKLKVKGFDLKAKKVKRNNLAGTKIDVIIKKDQKFPDLKSVLKLIKASRLDDDTKQKSKDVFIALAKAEAKVHKLDMHSVHFHQLGQLDTVIDVVGCLLAIKMLGIKDLYSSAITSGSGSIKLEDEELPLPAPAVLELLKHRTMKLNPDIQHELVTPTGAAIISTLTKELSNLMPWRILKIGYGAGTYTHPTLPNLLRVVLAEMPITYDADLINLVEVNLDDTLPLNFEILFERLFFAGALDVYTSSIMMKKMRPAILLSVQAKDEDLDNILSIIFKETSTLGVRINKIARRKLERKILKLKSDYGIMVKVKIGLLQGKVINIAPEYEDCKKISQKLNLPFKIVYERVKSQAVKELVLQ